jgi:hypothetical protein
LLLGRQKKEACEAQGVKRKTWQVSSFPNGAAWFAHPGVIEVERSQWKSVCGETRATGGVVSNSLHK